MLIPSAHDLLGISCKIRVFFETATKTNSEFSQLATDLNNPGGYLTNLCQPVRVLGVIVVAQ